MPVQKRKIPALFSHLKLGNKGTHLHHRFLILYIRLFYHWPWSTPTTNLSDHFKIKKYVETFKIVISDYQTPPNTTLTKTFWQVTLSHQIEYLKTARPLSVSMGNAIRLLKQEISHISIDYYWATGKVNIEPTNRRPYQRKNWLIWYMLIIENASKHVTNGSLFYFWAFSVLENLFKYCVNQQDKKFNLIIVDSRPLFEGKNLLTNLVKYELFTWYRRRRQFWCRICKQEDI